MDRGEFAYPVVGAGMATLDFSGHGGFNTRSAMRASLRILTFPIIYAGALGLGIVGYRHGWALPVIVPVVALTCLGLGAVLERVIPRFPEWNQSHRDVRTDLLHNLLNMVVTPETKMSPPMLLAAGYSPPWLHHLA
jgi:hypothetical protein